MGVLNNLADWKANSTQQKNRGLPPSLTESNLAMYMIAEESYRSPNMDLRVKSCKSFTVGKSHRLLTHMLFENQLVVPRESF